VPLSLEPCKIQHIYATGVAGHRSLYLNPRESPFWFNQLVDLITGICSHPLRPDNAHSLHPLYNTAQYGAAGYELSNLLVNSASYSASSFSFIDVCTEGGVQGLWYYVYGTSPLAPVVDAILMLVNDLHIARVFVELLRTSVVQDSSLFSELKSGTRLHLCTGLELWESGTQMHWT
jgi:hypothetical protein